MWAEVAASLWAALSLAVPTAVAEASEATVLEDAASASAPAAQLPNRRAEAARSALERIRVGLARGPLSLRATPYRVKAGSTATEVAVLRDRLLLEGYGDPTVTGRLREYFDPQLKRALWDWQRDHDLPVTTWLDDLTRERLNQTLSGLATEVQLAVSRWEQLERAPGAPFSSDSGRHILVHLNAGVLVAEEDGVEQLRMPVVIGRADPRNATPALSSRLTSVVAEPSWRLPRRIVDESLRPAVSDRVDLARDRGFEVTVDSSGAWRVVQPAGPDNPLGHAKFVLADTGGIYLHDTPSRDAIQATAPIAQRALSHGCIRLADSDALAAWVLGEAWDRRTGRRRGGASVPAEPVSVHLVYQTLTFDAAGRPRRWPDVYQRDAVARAEAALGAALGELDGHLAVVMFVADWCQACKALAPDLAALAERARVAGEDVALLGISIDGASRVPWPFRVHGVPPEVAAGGSAFGVVDVVPTTWLVGRTGVPLYRYEGAGHEVIAALEEDLRGYLAAERALEDPTPASDAGSITP